MGQVRFENLSQDEVISILEDKKNIELIVEKKTVGTIPRMEPGKWVRVPPTSILMDDAGMLARIWIDGLRRGEASGRWMVLHTFTHALDGEVIFCDESESDYLAQIKF